MANNTTDRQDIASVRPRLFAIAPLITFICLGYGLLNLLIGIGMFFLYQTTVQLAVANVLTYQQWGVVYFILGVAGLCALWLNNWTWVRRFLLCGLMIKSIWLVALVLRCIAYPPTVLITLVWLFLVYIQFITYVFFLSSYPNLIGRGSSDAQ